MISLGLLIGCLLASAPLCADGSNKKVYKIGIFPHMPLTRLFRLYNPAAMDIGKFAGIPVTMQTRPNFARFSHEIASGTYDIALIQPFDYPMAARNGYIAIARRGVPLTAVLIVPRNSTIQSLKDLNGKVIATPPRTAAVSHLTDIALKKHNIKPASINGRIYTRNHFSCMQSTLVGKAAACGTARQALAHWKKFNMRERLRIVYETAPVPHALFVVHRRVPKHIRLKIRQAIISWPDRPEGKVILQRGPLVPFVSASDGEYNIIRRYLKQLKK